MGERSFTEELREEGFDIEKAFLYCMNDESFYRTVLNSYLAASAEKRAGIERYFAEENWKEYQTLVHSLKSSSRTIGLEKLSEMAYVQEQAAKAADADTIRSGYAALLEEYVRVTGVIERVLGPAGGAAPQETAQPGGGVVLEFKPE
ncbi:MAG: Hpt domain-containing protein [Lachnospiraceae bacterium]|nr:Hpt domain-containing protein [Lachnospiraceae bacterium]